MLVEAGIIIAYRTELRLSYKTAWRPRFDLRSEQPIRVIERHPVARVITRGPNRSGLRWLRSGVHVGRER